MNRGPRLGAVTRHESRDGVHKVRFGLAAFVIDFQFAHDGQLAGDKGKHLVERRHWFAVAGVRALKFPERQVSYPA